MNLTSRLTGLARPSGIVIDGQFGINLLTDEQRDFFEEANVYLDGIAEDEPVQIYFTKEFTTIPKRNRQPIAAKRWRNVHDIKPYRDICKFDMFRYSLDSEPVSSEDIIVTARHRRVTGGRVDKRYSAVIDSVDFIYEVVGGRIFVSVNFAKLSKRLEKDKVKKNMNVVIDIDYVEK